MNLFIPIKDSFFPSRKNNQALTVRSAIEHTSITKMHNQNLKRLLTALCRSPRRTRRRNRNRS